MTPRIRGGASLWQRVLAEQRRLIPTDDLTPYLGQWVVIRDRKVAGHGKDPLALREGARETDGLLLVPSEPTVKTCVGTWPTRSTETVDWGTR